MTGAVREIDLVTARRLAVSSQRLAGRPRRSSPANVLDVLRTIRCVQLDPISVVARSPLLVLRSRVDGFRPEHLDRLLWRDRAAYEYWAHAASIVLTEDHPIHAWRMRRYLREGHARVRDWYAANARLRRTILARLRHEGPLPSRALADVAAESWRSTGWTNERNVDRMLAVLWGAGVVMVAGRQGAQKLWDLAERVLPNDAPRERLSDLEVTRRAFERSLLALGVATPRHVRHHFTVNRYPELEKVVRSSERSGRIERVVVVDDGTRLPGSWYVHADRIGMLDAIERGRWTPRTTLLSPFDNLIRAYEQTRTKALFGVSFTMEIYVPKDRRRYGYYAMPVLHGDRFVARVDPAFERDARRLRIEAVHAEPGEERSAAVGDAVGESIRELGAWLGAERVDLAGLAPARWRRRIA